MVLVSRLRGGLLIGLGVLALSLLPSGAALAKHHSPKQTPDLALAPPPVVAGSVPIGQSMPTDAGLLTTEIALNQLQTQPRPMILHFDRDAIQLSFPISVRFQPKKVGLHLEFTNSIALIDARSQMRVYIGDTLVAQLPLHGSQPHVVADIDIPVDLLQPGYNNLRIETTQHYTYECEDPSAPELWTEIDTVKSHLSFAGTLAPLHPTLAQLDDLLGPGVGGVQDIVIAGAKPSPDNALLRYGELVSQALAFHLQYRQPVLSYAVASARAPSANSASDAGREFPRFDDTAFKGKDVILVGTSDDLASILPADVLNQINGGFLGTYTLDDDPSRLLLIVSGRTEADVDKAASALAVLNFPFDNVATSTISQLAVPDISPFVRSNLVQPGTKYQFSDLGYQTTTNQTNYPFNYQVSFMLPADIHALEDANIDLALDFSYGAGLDYRSVMNIMVNNVFQQVVQLNQDGGAVLHGYTISIPLRTLQPGLNTVRFDVSLMSHNLGKCQDVDRHDNKIMTLFDTSTIAFPPAARIATQPDLQMLGRTGFPLATSAHGQGLDVAVTALDPDAMVASWELMAKLSQTTGIFLSDANVHFGLTSAAAHMLVVGPVSSLDPSLLQGSALDLQNGLAGTAFLPYRSFPVVSTAGGLSGIVGYVLPAPQPIAHPLVQNTGSLGDLGAIFAFESPYAARHSVVVVTAENSSLLRARVEDLIDPAVWSQLSGDVSVWHGPKDPVEFAKVAHSFIIGDRTSVTYVAYYVTGHPLPWIAAIVVAALVLAILARIILVRRRRQVHPNADEMH